MSDSNDSNEGRLARAETEIKGFHDEMRGMWAAVKDTKDAVDKLATAFSDSNKTDWMTFATISGLVLTLIGCLWATAIHPIAADVERSALAADKLAAAVLVQNDKINESRSDVRDLQLLIRVMQNDLDKIASENLDKRLALIEHDAAKGKLP